MDIYNQIYYKLQKLKNLDKQFQVFGSNKHKYQLNECLSNEEVMNIEKRIGITLPDEYRNFLIEIGDGGAGPHFGLYKISKAVMYSYKDLSTNFPHTQNWNDYKNEEDYSDDKYISGALNLCPEGCGHITMLILSGKERGNMWGDSRCSDDGIYPLSSDYKNKERLTFLEWYEEWLDRNIQDYEYVITLLESNLPLTEINNKYMENRVTLANNAKDIISSILDKEKPEELFGNGNRKIFYDRQGQEKWYDEIFKHWKK